MIIPNHLHWILIIDDSRQEINSAIISTESDSKIGGKTGIKDPMLHRNISTAIRWFKGKTTLNSNKINKKFNLAFQILGSHYSQSNSVYKNSNLY